MTEPAKVAELAVRCGVQLEYPDIWGNRHGVTLETQMALLGAMGMLDGETSVETALAELDGRPWQTILEPVLVTPLGKPSTIVMRIGDNEAAEQWEWVLTEERGPRHRGAFKPFDLTVVDARDGMSARQFQLAVELGLGYHRLELRCGKRVVEQQIIVTPNSCFVPPELTGEGRAWGLAVQLYALRSRRNWGIGDFRDLRALVETVSELGGGVVGINPLHAMFAHNPENASPYSPSSRLFCNVIYLDVESITDFEGCEPAQSLVCSNAFTERLAVLRRAKHVAYTAVARAKLEVCELLFAHFLEAHWRTNSELGGHLRDFVDAGGVALRRHAIFEAIQESLYQANREIWGWQVWPEELRDPLSPAVDKFCADHSERVLFHQYLQWQVDLQLNEVMRRARSANVWLYQDLALGCDRAGAETWSNKRLYAMGASIGAPPDDFNLQGQNWGLPPLVPLELRGAKYAPFVAALRASMKHAGALRIDHVMGLMRLFWVPEGRSAGDGAYVHYPLGDLLGIVALESQRNRCIVIGEDLGTVPDELRAALAPTGILSYRLFYFEKTDGHPKPPAAFAANALAAVSTHDLPTIAGYWKGQDIAERSQLGMFPSDQVHAEQVRTRANDRARLLEALEREGLLPEGMSVDPASCPDMTVELARAIHAYVARTPCKIMMVQLEDVLLQLDQVNLPGTSNERPNWRLRLSLNLEDIVRGDRLRDLAAELRRIR